MSEPAVKMEPTRENQSVTSCPHVDDAKLLAGSFGYPLLRLIDLSQRPLNTWPLAFFPLTEEWARMIERCPDCRSAFDEELGKMVKGLQTIGDGHLPCPEDTADLIAYAVNRSGLPIEFMNRIRLHIDDDTHGCKACGAYVQSIRK